MTLADLIGTHVICPWPWCVCGYALGIAPGEVVDLDGEDLVVKLDLSGCSERSGRCHMDQLLVFTAAEIDELAWVL